MTLANMLVLLAVLFTHDAPQNLPWLNWPAEKNMPPMSVTVDTSHAPKG